MDKLDKKCSECLKVKPVKEFNKNNTRPKNPYRARCRACEKIYRKSINTPQTMRNAHLKRSYGITLQDYDKMFLAQGGKCVICKRHRDELKQNLHVDHCHASGKVRALLCFNCNQMLGNASDSVDRLSNAIEYLNIFAK